jgi:hypothetical protein
MGESPRWHDDRLWLSDWGAQEILAIDLNGKSEVEVRIPFAFPFALIGLIEHCSSYRGAKDYSCAGSEMDPC